MSAGDRLRRTLWLWPPVLAGMCIRLWNLRGQVLGDDEWHLVNALHRYGFPEILFTYQASDACLPLSALFRAWVVAGGTVSELGLRLPSLLAGLLLVVAAPLWAERWLGRPVALSFAWLAALSPPLVLYSRIARSYLPMVLLGAVAAAAFWAWWTSPDGRSGGRRRLARGAVFVVTAAATLYVHLGAGPFVAAPFLWFAGVWGGERWKRSRRPETGGLGGKKGGFAIAAGPRGSDPPGLAAALALGAGLTAACLLFLVPALPSLTNLLRTKRVDGMELTGDTCLKVLQLASGSSLGWVAWVFWGLALVGLVRLFRRRSQLAGLSATLVVGHVAGILVLDPVGLANPVIFHRYLLVALPVVLLWVAVALAGVVEAVALARPGRPLLGWAAVAVVLASWVAAGPLVRYEYWGSSFAHHNAFLSYYRPLPVLVDRPVDQEGGTRSRPADRAPNQEGGTRSRVAERAANQEGGTRSGDRADQEGGTRLGVYERLAEEAGKGAVLEAPWYWFWNTNYTFPLAQAIHRRPVIVGQELPVVDAVGMGFRNTTTLSAAAFLAGRARFVVIHKDITADEARVLAVGWLELGRRPPGEVPERLTQLGGYLTRRLKETWGEPWYEDHAVAAWDLDAVRAREGGTPIPRDAAETKRVAPGR